jgi:hypothetical protein
MTRAAFTLLETMLAIGLTSAVGLAALSLNTMQARLGTAARAQEENLALITETVRLLDDDLVLAASHPTYGRFQVLDGGALRLMTSCRLPGEPPGLHEVVWRFDAATGAVLRSSTPLGGGEATTRPVGWAWKLFAIGLDHDRLWLDGRIGASEEPWRLPLWTEEL